MNLSYVVPAHNEVAVLDSHLGSLVARLAQLPGADVVVVENGSADGTWAIAERWAGEHDGVRVEAYREPQRGLGFAYDRALRELARRERERRPEWIVLGAADLPFAFTDLHGALRAVERGGAPRLLLGSKAHPESRVPASLRRRAASRAYRFARRAVLGMRSGDCQGTIVIDATLAFDLRPHVESRGYFYTTELVYLAERCGERFEEFPVVLEPSERKSTLRLLQDGSKMGFQLLALRARSGQCR